jgi:hypothetical protein
MDPEGGPVCPCWYDCLGEAEGDIAGDDLEAGLILPPARRNAPAEMTLDDESEYVSDPPLPIRR